MSGQRPASEALRRIGMFPPESATVSQMRAAPRTDSPPPDPADAWRAAYGRTPEWDLLADLWELQANKGRGKGKSPAKYPREVKIKARRGSRSRRLPPQ